MQPIQHSSICLPDQGKLSREHICFPLLVAVPDQKCTKKIPSATIEAQSFIVSLKILLFLSFQSNQQTAIASIQSWLDFLMNNTRTQIGKELIKGLLEE